MCFFGGKNERRWIKLRLQAKDGLSQLQFGEVEKQNLSILVYPTLEKSKINIFWYFIVQMLLADICEIGTILPPYNEKRNKIARLRMQ